MSQLAPLAELSTVKPLIKDTPKEDKPPNKGQAKSTHVYTLYRESPLKEDNLSTKDKMKDKINGWSRRCPLLRGSNVHILYYPTVGSLPMTNDTSPTIMTI